MAYNHGREDRKWRIWKEAEEKILLTVRTEDGNVFEIVCRQAAGKEDGWTTAN